MKKRYNEGIRIEKNNPLRIRSSSLNRQVVAARKAKILVLRQQRRQTMIKEAFTVRVDDDYRRLWPTLMSRIVQTILRSSGLFA